MLQREDEIDAQLAGLLGAPLVPLMDVHFELPGRKASFALEKLAKEDIESHSLNLANVMWKGRSSTIRIQVDDVNLQLRICKVGHFDQGGHRGYDSALSPIRKYFTSDNMNEDIGCFFDSFLRCASTSAGPRVARLYGHALHIDELNEVIHLISFSWVRATLA